MSERKSCKMGDFRGFIIVKVSIGRFGAIFFNGGDVDENRHFIEGKLKLVAHYQNLNIFQWGRC